MGMGRKKLDASALPARGSVRLAIKASLGGSSLEQRQVSSGSEPQPGPLNTVQVVKKLGEEVKKQAVHSHKEKSVNARKKAALNVKLVFPERRKSEETSSDANGVQMDSGDGPIRREPSADDADEREHFGLVTNDDQGTSMHDSSGVDNSSVPDRELATTSATESRPAGNEPVISGGPMAQPVDEREQFRLITYGDSEVRLVDDPNNIIEEQVTGKPLNLPLSKPWELLKLRTLLWGKIMDACGNREFMVDAKVVEKAGTRGPVQVLQFILSDLLPAEDPYSGFGFGKRKAGTEFATIEVDASGKKMSAIRYRISNPRLSLESKVELATMKTACDAALAGFKVKA